MIIIFSYHHFEFNMRRNMKVIARAFGFIEKKFFRLN